MEILKRLENIQLFNLCLVATLFLIPGIFLQIIQDVNLRYLIVSLVALGLFSVVMVLLFNSSYKRYGSRLFLISGVFLLITMCLLFLANFILGFIVVPWPINGLHGQYAHSGEKGWGRIVSMDASSFGFNKWGQRDYERTIEPKKGVYRIAFIGDSFLEESVKTPVSVLVNDAISQKNTEVINLGVSATDLTEYYYRLKNIGLELGIKECFIFYYTGNDYRTQESMVSLKSFFGIAAVYPLDSIFSYLGLYNLNHILTDKWRPSNRTWFPSTNQTLHQWEQNLLSDFRNSSNSEIIERISREMALSQDETNRLKDKLDNKDSFFTILRNPDKDLFRRYVLFGMINGFLNNNSANQNITTKYTYDYIRKIRKLSDENDVKFTLVIIPTFLVDKRIRSQWSDLYDVQYKRSKITQELIKQSRSDGINVIDLYPVFSGESNSYLNLDGHWSDTGNELVRDVIIDYLNSNGTNSLQL